MLYNNNNQHELAIVELQELLLLLPISSEHDLKLGSDVFNSKYYEAKRQEMIDYYYSYTYVRLIDSLVKLKRYQDAIYKYDEGIKLAAVNPENTDAKFVDLYIALDKVSYNYALALIGINKYDEANKVLNERISYILKLFNNDCSYVSVEEELKLLYTVKSRFYDLKGNKEKASEYQRKANTPCVL